MYVFPLVQREFQSALRRPSTRRLRVGFAVGTMAVTIWVFLVWGESHPFAAFSTWSLFQVLSGLAACAAVATGVLVAADSISRERRESTLAFLFLTELTAIDVVFGKLAAAGIVPLVTLVGMFPGLAICQLMGGVPVGEFWRGILLLPVALFFSISSALFVSSYCAERRKAAAGASALLLLLNPLWLWGAAADYWRAPSQFWLLLLAFLGLGLLFLFQISRTLEQTWRDSGDFQRATNFEGKGEQPANQVSEGKAISWLILRRRNSNRFLGWANMILMGMTYLYLVTDLIKGKSPARLLTALFLIHIALLVVTLARTAYAFYNDRQDGALELILGAPLTTEEIFTGFSSALFTQSAVWLVYLSALDVFCSVLLRLNNRIDLVSLPLAMAGTLWTGFYGTRWLGVYRSLMMNHPSISVLATFVRISFFPALLSGLFLSAPKTDVSKVSIFWIFSSAFLALFFGLDARSALLKHGRELLLRPHTEKPPHIENEWSFIDWSETVNELSCVNWEDRTEASSPR